jgi:hypothetical protein
LHPLAAAAILTLLCCFLLLMFCYKVLELAQSLGYGVENPDGVAFSQFAASQLDWETIQVRGRGEFTQPVLLSLLSLSSFFKILNLKIHVTGEINNPYFSEALGTCRRHRDEQ